MLLFQAWALGSSLGVCVPPASPSMLATQQQRECRNRLSVSVCTSVCTGPGTPFCGGYGCCYGQLYVAFSGMGSLGAAVPPASPTMLTTSGQGAGQTGHHCVFPRPALHMLMLIASRGPEGTGSTSSFLAERSWRAPHPPFSLGCLKSRFNRVFTNASFLSRMHLASIL